MDATCIIIIIVCFGLGGMEGVDTWCALLERDTQPALGRGRDGHRNAWVIPT